MERRNVFKLVEIIGCIILAIFGVYLFICNINHYVPEHLEETIMMYFIAYGIFIGPMVFVFAIYEIKEIIDHWWW